MSAADESKVTIADKLDAMIDDLALLAHTMNGDGCHNDALRAQAAIMAVVALRDGDENFSFDADWPTQPALVQP